MDKYLGKVENADLVEKHKIPGLSLRRQAEKEAGADTKGGKVVEKRPNVSPSSSKSVSLFFHKDQQNNILFLDLDDKIPSSPLLIT